MELAIKLRVVETQPLNENSFKTSAVRDVWKVVKSQIEPKIPFRLLRQSSGSYEAYSYLIPYIANFIEQDNHDAMAELWQFISSIPVDILDFACNANIPSPIPETLHPTVYAIYLMALRLGWERSPRITLLHGSRELAQFAKSHQSMSDFHDLQSASALFANLLKSSFARTYKLDEKSLTDIEPQHLVEAAIRLCFGRRQFDDGMLNGAVMAFPGQEMVRDRHGNQYAHLEEAFWRRKWVSLGGKLFKNRIIALKTDPIWCSISRFGKPYPPFDFNSCMGVMDVARRECVNSGLNVSNKKVVRVRKRATMFKNPIGPRHKDNRRFKVLFFSALVVGVLIYIAYRMVFFSKSILAIF